MTDTMITLEEAVRSWVEFYDKHPIRTGYFWPDCVIDSVKNMRAALARREKALAEAGEAELRLQQEVFEGPEAYIGKDIE